LQAYLGETYYWQQRFLQSCEAGGSEWFDDSRTQVVENRDDIIRRAGHNALEALSRDHGADIAGWHWGDAHTVTFAHPFIPGKDAARWLGGGTHALSGSGETLQRGVYDFNAPYEASFIDSVRMVVDLSDDEKVIAHFPGGASERLFDPWNKNFVGDYISGDKRYWWFSDEAIEANKKYELILAPRL
jgi:penicillin amidase